MTITFGCLLLVGCDDAKVTACFGDAGFCERVITGTNQPPDADAGADLVVSAGDPVSLDGSASRDPDGHIVSFSWTQTAGTPVTLAGADSAVATFDAPEVSAVEDLTFRLTVVDDDRSASDEEVSVTVEPPASAASHGVALLTDALAPEPVQVLDPCVDAITLTGDTWFAFAGLWLAVQATALEATDHPDHVTRFLDAARVLLAHGESRPAPGNTAASLWDHGVASLADFTRLRDPGLSSWAGRLRIGAGGHPLIPGIEAGEAVLAGAGGQVTVIGIESAAAESAAAAYLLEARCEARPDPLGVASRTLFLLSHERSVTP